MICTQPLPSIFALYNAFGQSSGGKTGLDWFDDDGGGVGYVELIPKENYKIEKSDWDKYSSSNYQ